VLFFGGQIGAELLVAAVIALVLWEYTPFCDQAQRGSTFVVMLVTGLGLYATVCWGPHDWLSAAVVFGMFAVLTWAMLSQDTPEAGAKMGAMMAFGLIYIPLPMAIIPKVRAMDQGLALIFLVLVSTWAADTGAYFAGRFLGKTKLLERISPKKTWAGVWGGVALAVVCAVGMSAAGYPEIPTAHAAALGGLVSVVGVVGDLIESMFKRASSIKDSGGIMPGHGGLLDRVDSLLFTVPAAWVYLRLAGLG
jgi:phosphatidate cytidylyltransferase